MPITRFPTAVQALLRADGSNPELRLTIATNTGRTLDESVIYGSTGLDDNAQRQIDEHLTRAGLRRGAFEGNARAGWRAVVQSTSIDPAAATD
jgi:hypothetical protein